jgi:hypothetical protein
VLIPSFVADDAKVHAGIVLEELKVGASDCVIACAQARQYVPATTQVVMAITPCLHASIHQSSYALALPRCLITHAPWSQAILYIALLVRAVATTNSFTGTIILVNAAPHPSQLGTVNGVGQTVASFLRGAGPAAAGLLWSASLGLPGAHQFMPFGFVTLIAVAAIVLFRFVAIAK